MESLLSGCSSKKKGELMIYTCFNLSCSRETWCMVHDPWCFKAYGRCIMGPSTVCNMPASRARNTSIGGQFGFGIFVGIQRNTPVFIMVYPDSKALHALLFCFGFGREEDGKIETATLEERQKINWSIKQNNNFARALVFFFFFVHFVAVNARPQRENA